MASNLKHLLVALILVWQANVVLISQSVNYIEGKVISTDTHEPVPFATIQLKDHQFGVYANADGDFRIMRRSSEFQSDSVIITCIGFKRYSVSIQTI